MRIINLNKSEKGQALVEFALILPIFLLLIVAVIDFGWNFMGQIQVTNGVREAARYYAVHKIPGTEAEVETVLKAKVTEHLTIIDPADVTVDTTVPAGEKVTVEATAYLPPLTGFFYKEDIKIVRSAIMRVEYK